jgi:hypothetical protein
MLTRRTGASQRLGARLARSCGERPRRARRSDRGLKRTRHDVSAAGLSNDVAMTDGDATGPSPESAREQGSVLANLPRTRPQRSSARRAAARGTAASNGHPAAGAATKAATKPARKHARVKVAATKPRRQTTSAPKETARTSSPTSGPTATNAPAASAEAKSSRGSTQRPSSAVRARRERAAKRPAAPPRPLASEEPAPRQGFECESERADGPVQPPGGTELVASAAEIVGELAKAGLSVGERLFRDVFSRLPGN